MSTEASSDGSPQRLIKQNNATCVVFPSDRENYKISGFYLNSEDILKNNQMTPSRFQGPFESHEFGRPPPPLPSSFYFPRVTRGTAAMTHQDRGHSAPTSSSGVFMKTSPISSPKSTYYHCYGSSTLILVLRLQRTEAILLYATRTF